MIWKILVELVLLLGSWYIFLPPINLTSWDFLIFISVHLLICLVLFGFNLKEQVVKVGVSRPRQYANQTLAINRSAKVILGVLGLLWLGIALVSLWNAPLFQAKNYAKVVSIEEKDFKEFPKSDTSQVPILDRATAEKIGDRYLGSLTDKVSQYVAADSYTQLTVDGKPYRVTPLEYAGPIKWLNNHDKGIGEYIKVDMVTGNADLVDLKKPMRYSDSEYFNHDVKRYLRFKYPTKIFKKPSFEIDDKGNPYYIATVYRKVFGLAVPRPQSVIILDATNGQTKEYSLDQVPDWVDRVYPANESIKQMNYNGAYKDGFWNALFAKKNVTQTTEGYNYLSIGNDIYLYTGVTSANADESNLGFLLQNMRTGQIVKYNLASATETSAQASAEGAVQEKSYKATFPILIKLADRPLYIMGLKDNADLVKEYALVDAVEYQNVLTATSVTELLNKFYKQNNLEVDDSEVEKIAGQVADLRSAVIDGNTVYFFKVDGKIVKVKASVSDNLPYLENGQNFQGELGKNNYLKTFELR